MIKEKSLLNKRQTFAIISHPDAGKTTLTEKILLFGQLIQLAGTVKAKKSLTHVLSDWMDMEKKRGISVTTSVIQFPYKQKMVNLLDTPGHEDFSEDTYRTLTAVDSALMVVDGVKGIEDRTIKLMQVCRLRTTPIWTFINKFDRDTRDPVALIDEIEAVLNIQCAPMNWPIGSGKNFKGVYDLYSNKTILFENGHGHHIHTYQEIQGIDNPKLDKEIEDFADELRYEVELIKGASHSFDYKKYHAGELTPVFFGTALSNFGVKEMLDAFSQEAPNPLPRQTNTRIISPNEDKFTGFVFKIQANMDRQHHDRIAFVRICSGVYRKGIKLYHVRLGKFLQIRNGLGFVSGSRKQLDEAFPGDIIGLHNHGSIQIGDTFTQGENLTFKGIPNFAPELFKRIQLKDPMKMKSLLKGLIQLSEEGATQIFRPLNSNNIIVGVIGILQFDVVSYRLKHEYSVNCSYENINITTSRWVTATDKSKLDIFISKYSSNLARDGSQNLIYLAPTRVNLDLTIERNIDINFLLTTTE